MVEQRGIGEEVARVSGMQAQMINDDHDDESGKKCALRVRKGGFLDRLFCCCCQIGLCNRGSKYVWNHRVQPSRNGGEYAAVQR